MYRSVSSVYTIVCAYTVCVRVYALDVLIACVVCVLNIIYTGYIIVEYYIITYKILAVKLCMQNASC